MRSKPLTKQRLLRWAAALAFALAAAALQWAVRPWFGVRAPFLFFLPAIVAAAAFAGRGGGLLVVAIGLVSAERWLAGDRLWVDTRPDVMSLVVYVGLGLLLTAIGARMRRSSARASAAEQRLLLAGEDTGVGIFDLDLGTRT
ncbi:MAG TPA: DUF4118 domain-containing protein, partial [Burkholderiaceae bacterium]